MADKKQTKQLKKKSARVVPILTPSNEFRSPVADYNSINIDDSRRIVHPTDDVADEGQDNIGMEKPELDDSVTLDAHRIQVSAEPGEPVPTINNMQTLMHIFKGNIGTGILALPIAVMHAGLWTGFVGILCVGGIAVHCMHMLINCNEILCRRTGCSVLDYAGVMQTCLKTGHPFVQRFSRFVRPFVDALLIFTQLGACCVYIVFIATNIRMVVTYYLPSSSLNVRVYELCVMLVLIPFVCIRNLRLLAPFSAFANILTMTGLIIIIQYIVQGLPSTTARRAFSSFDEIPLFFGTAIFTVEGIGLVLPLRNSMKRPQDFGGWFGVLNLGMCATVCLYATIGFYGYLKFGEAIQESITLSLPNDGLYLSVRLMFAMSILITYNIQFYVPITIMWPKIVARVKGGDAFRKYGEYIFRIGIVLITFGFAAAVPNIDLLISLIGAVACSFLALILPAIIEVVTLMAEDAPLPIHIVLKDILIFLFGVFGSVIGTYTSLKAIVNTF